jgi:hypothetical protein
MERPRQRVEACALRSLRPRFVRALLLASVLLVGCQPCRLRDPSTQFSPQAPCTAFLPIADGVRGASASLARAERDYTAAAAQDAEGLSRCVDLYYAAALEAWRCLELSSVSSGNPDDESAGQLYQRSLAGLITAAGRYERLDPRGHLTINDAFGRRQIPIAYHGFPWQPCEFCQVLSATDFRSHDILRHYETPGLGFSLVAIRQASGDAGFYPPRQHFPVTAVLRPAAAGAVLEFYNPYLYDTLTVGPSAVALQRDLTAPFACALHDTPRKFTEGFLDPSDADIQPKLFVMEPYQRGKIPVVFIHGLWSDPITWVDAVNDLRAQSDIYRQYQFWFFRYPTGRGLLGSAAELREQILLARDCFDPTHRDPAMDRMVLVGHSMGGLVARLQISYSSDILWQHTAKQPLEMVRASPQVRQRLQRDFFFDPSPLVTRAVFIGTPHHGAIESRRLVGRMASSLVGISQQEKSLYQQLMDDNRDIFDQYLWHSWPTTIDLLEPSNPLLQAMACMPINPCVRMHSIVGTGGSILSSEPGDGVVPVSSARQPGVCSELMVPARHAKLPRDAASTTELMRILRQHAQPSTAL